MTLRSQEISQPEDSPLFLRRMELARINDRLSTLQAEAEALLRQRDSVQKEITALEDAP